MVLFIYINPLSAEAFGNNIISIPSVGLIFYDISWLPHHKPWGLKSQWMGGLAFGQALSYKWWWMAETALGLGKLNNQALLSSFSGGAGVKYHLTLDDVRPYLGIKIHYLQFLGQGVKDIPLNLGWPIFVGLKPHLGLEWLFYAEMSLALDIAYGLYVNINEPFRRILYSSLSYALYF